MKKPRPKPTTRSVRVRYTFSVPCPHCGSPSRVFRTRLGERSRTSRRKRIYVTRERRCLSPAHHRFVTEEHPR